MQHIHSERNQYANLKGKDHAIGGACLIDIKETGCVNMDFISLAQQTVQ
jgi:hypothetical protein